MPVVSIFSILTIIEPISVLCNARWCCPRHRTPIVRKPKCGSSCWPFVAACVAAVAIWIVSIAAMTVREQDILAASAHSLPQADANSVRANRALAEIA